MNDRLLSLNRPRSYSIFLFEWFLDCGCEKNTQNMLSHVTMWARSTNWNITFRDIKYELASIIVKRSCLASNSYPARWLVIVVDMVSAIESADLVSIPRQVKSKTSNSSSNVWKTISWTTIHKGKIRSRESYEKEKKHPTKPLLLFPFLCLPFRFPFLFLLLLATTSISSAIPR